MEQEREQNISYTQIIGQRNRQQDDCIFQVPTQKSLGYLLMAKGTTPHLRVVLLITVRAFQSPSALSVKGEHPL